MNNLRPGANVVSWWLGRKPDAVLYSWLGKKINYCQHSKFWAIVRAKLFILQMDFFFVVRHDVFLAFGLVQHILSGRIEFCHVMLAVANCGTITNTHYCSWFHHACYSSFFHTFFILSCFILATTNY